jgi:sugar phosphate permease
VNSGARLRPGEPPSGAQGDAPPDAGAALYRRVAVALIPFLFACYVVAMIDRLNVGYAKLQFMGELHFDEAAFGVAAGSLYVGYILFEIPSNLMLQRLGVRVTLLRIMVLWGTFTMAMAFASSRWGFYSIRFLIGAAEAGFFPGMIYYSTLWFPNRYRARVISAIAFAVPVSGVIAAPVSAWILSGLNGAGGLSGWQWLFLLEGAPAVLLGVAAYFYLPNRPGQARFLTPAQRQAIATDLEREAAGSGGPRGRAGSASFAQALRRPRTYALALVYFAFYATQSILLLWVPTLLRNAGAGSLDQIAWRAAAVSLAGVLGMAAIGWSSDRSGERRWHLLACGAAGCAAFLALPAVATSADGTTACLMAAAAAMFAFLALFWTVPTAELGADARAGGIALVSSIGASGSALSPMFMGSMKVLTGSLFGAIAALVAAFACGLAALAWLLARREGQPRAA